MIDEIIKRFDAKRDELLGIFSKEHIRNYKTLVEIVVKAVSTGTEYGKYNFDPERITEIDYGEYQGTLIYVISEKGYMPSDYWYTKVSYGSCSGCDTLQAIHEYADSPPTEKQAQEYLTLALHLVQGMKEL